MTFDYNRTAQTAKTLLTKFGRACTLRRVTVGAYNPATGSASETVNDTTVTAADFAVKGETTVNGTLITMGDRYALISGVDIATVSISDRLIIDGVTWNIIEVLKVAPAGDTVINKVYIRK